VNPSLGQEAQISSLSFRHPLSQLQQNILQGPYPQQNGVGDGQQTNNDQRTNDRKLDSDPLFIICLTNLCLHIVYSHDIICLMCSEAHLKK
uniref:Ovule protein n=1 Tax=Romanomermis culicivorax TaxID=13658 RepID=A0A915HLF9_ROMCU